MVEQCSKEKSDQFSCSVCLEVLRDPVTIPCGHSYCLDCIEDYWNRVKQKSQYSCPQCRQVFNPKPLLSRNTVLGEVVEKFQQTGSQGAVQHLTNPTEVKCSICKGRQSKAVKSCLVCLDSYCASHLKVHEERHHGKTHRLIPATDELRARLCPQHDKVVRLYCRTDQLSVCSQCVRERHMGHDCVSVAHERTEQQKKLRESSMKSLQKLNDTEKELRYIIKYIKVSVFTKAAVEESERIFSRLIRSIEKQSCEVKELIRVQERAAVSQAEELLEKVQRETAELKRSEEELEKLCHTEDHLSISLPEVELIPAFLRRLKVFYMFSVVEMSTLSSGVLPNVANFKCSAAKRTQVEVPFNLEPKTRADFLYYYNDIGFDQNTANPYLSFSNGQREVTTHLEPQPYPDHPDRFTSWAQVLCRAGMAGRCYWEVEWSGKGGVSIGVCYKNISRNRGGSDSKIGHNTKSWSLDCSHSICSFQHNKESVSIATPSSNRIGVYLDFRGGALSFYSVSDTMVLLQKIKTTFNQPVYPGFWVGLGSTLKLRSL
uniref:FinTRIM family, member 87 n=1 Tax=Cynoglossus semilaevis TaxID=244447 RepID=A0A3P8W3T0_CYNSE